MSTYERLVSELEALGFGSLDAPRLADKLLLDFCSVQSVAVAVVVRLRMARMGEW